jgi:hypothetical protein
MISDKTPLAIQRCLYFGLVIFIEFLIGLIWLEMEGTTFEYAQRGRTIRHESETLPSLFSRFGKQLVIFAPLLAENRLRTARRIQPTSCRSI